MTSYVSVAAATALSRAERRSASGGAGATRHGQRAAGHQSAHAPGVSKVKGVSPHPELWTSTANPEASDAAGGLYATPLLFTYNPHVEHIRKIRDWSQSQLTPR